MSESDYDNHINIPPYNLIQDVHTYNCFNN